MKKKQTGKGKRKRRSSASMRVAEPHGSQTIRSELEEELKIGRKLMREYRKTFELLAKM